jgi:hypothetical protein
VTYQQLWDQLTALPPGPIHHDLLFWEIKKCFEKELGVHTPAPPSMTSTDPNLESRFQSATKYIKNWMKPVDSSEPYVINEVLEHPAEVIISFDLRWPLPHQLNVTKNFLESQAGHLTSLGVSLDKDHRMHPDYFPNYLRLLDAEAIGASLKTMAEIIYKVIDEYPDHGGEQNARDGLNRARWLRDKGYRFLLMATQA